MAIFRGTTGTGSSDNTIVSAVTEQAGIATTKASEAEGFRDEAEGFKNTASSQANLATTKANEASADASGADSQRQLCVALRLEAYDSAQDALASANAAEASATTANSSAVQTVAGSNTQVVGVYNNIANVNTVAGVNTDVTTVAGISSDVTTVAADASDIGTVSTNIANVNNVGNNIANVNAVHGNASNINTVAADGTDIGTVATNIANVNTVAGISSTVTTVAGLESKMDTVIADASDIGAVAGNIGDVTTVAGINSDVDTVAGIAAKVTTVADNISDVQNADTNATNAASSASNASASATSASNSATTATTKATEASNSATAASNSATTATTKASQAAGSATTAGTSASTATTKASEASASATTATTKAGEAASSASAASGSATTATTKAAEADASAVSAASSATKSSNAASTWNNFYNSYLGVADAPPSVDVLGNAIVAGALYYDTGAGSNTVGLYVYNGSSWVYSTNYNNVTAPYTLAQNLNADGNNITAVGSLGIGTSSPSAPLHVKSATDAIFRLESSDSNAWNYMEFQGNTARQGWIGSDNNNAIQINADNASKILLSGGNVGIGTSSPSAMLDVELGATGTIAEFRGGDSDILQIKNENDLIVFDTRNTASGLAFQMQGTERMRIDSSGKVGIGTTSPAQKLDVSSAGTTRIQVKNTNLTSSGLYIAEDGTGAQINETGAYPLRFNTSGSERMRIDSSGNVGIGTTSITDKLTVNGGIKAIQSDSVNTSAIALDFGSDIARVRSTVNGTGTQRPLGFFIGGSEKARIDSSGNLLVGTTSTANNTDGIRLLNAGYISIAQDSNNVPCGFFNKITHDGNILEFQKDGSIVGSIGTYNGELHIDSSTGVRFETNAWLPKKSNSMNDANVSLGSGTYRFKDLYLSGGVHLGGTGTANKLDDYEEGTWTPSFNGYSTGFTGTYTKIGDIVHCRIARTTAIASGSITGSVIITGLPFTAQRAYTSPLGQIRGTTTTGASSRPYGIVHGSVVGLFTDDSFGDVAYYNASSANWDGSNFKQNSTAIYMAWEFTYRV